MNFLRDIADMSLEHASAFHNLRLHIPHTLVPAKELMWLSSDIDGRLSVSSDFEIKHFIEKVEHIERKSSLKKEQEYLSGHAFILKRDTPQETVTRLIEWEEVRKLESGVDMEYIVQHYISSSKASSTTTRLFFFNPSSKAFSNKVSHTFNLRGVSGLLSLSRTQKKQNTLKCNEDLLSEDTTIYRDRKQKDLD